jgi:hypothetical protein
MFQPYLDGITTRRSTAMAALAHGKCLISTSGASTEDVWRSTSGVHLIASRQPSQIAEEIDQIISSPLQAERRGREGLELYECHFALSHTIHALLGPVSN